MLLIASGFAFTGPGKAMADIWLTSVSNATTYKAWNLSTEQSPAWAGNATLYTSNLLVFQPNYTFHYEPGVYETLGWDVGWNYTTKAYDPAVKRKTAGTNCKHIGAGTNTVIRLVGAAQSNTDGVIFGCNGWEESCDGFELRNLLLDCNAQNQPKFANGQPKWIYVDLTSNAVVDKVILHWTSQFAQEYRIDVSTNLSLGWNTVYNTTTGAGGIETNTFSASPARYVRFYAPRLVGTHDMYQLTEFKVFGTSDPNVNIALTNPAVADSQWGGYEAEKAFDGSLTTLWTSTTHGMVTALATAGNNVTLSNITVINFGTKRGKECFPIFHTTVKHGAATTFSNVVFSGVTFTSPASNNTDGLTCCLMHIFKGPLVAGGPVVTHTLLNSYATNCLVSNVLSDFSYASAFSVPKLVDSIIDGAETGFYHEPNVAYEFDYGIDYVVSGNLFTNVNFGIFLQVTGNSNEAVANSLTVVSNRFYLSEHPLWQHGDAISWYVSQGATSTVGKVVITDNLFSTNDYDPGFNLFGISFRQFGSLVTVTNALAAYNTINLPDIRRGLTLDSNLALQAALFENRNGTNQLLPVIQRIGGSDIGPTNGTQQRADFNADSRADILWRDQFTGSNLVWFMQGTNLIASNYLSRPLLPGSWRAGAIGDFSGDVNNDIIWQSADYASNLVWGLVRTNWTEEAYVAKVTYSTGFQLCGSGDFNRDGYADLLWRDGNVGSNLLWLRVDNDYWLEVVMPTRTGNVVIGGTGDFDGNHSIDILWRDYTTGLQDVWLFDGTNFLQTVLLNPAVSRGTDEHIVAVEDFTGEGRPDLLWRNYQTGTLSFWRMDTTNIAHQSTLNNLPTMPLQDWSVASGPPGPATLTRYVKTTGSDANPGSYDLPYRTIQYGGNNSPVGTVLRVAAGNYPENVNVRGVDVKITVIDGLVNLRQ